LDPFLLRGHPMFVTFVKPIAVSILLVASGPQMPRFDIERVCQSTPEVHWNHATMSGCRHDERAARNDLRQKWLQIPLRYRQQCVAESAGIDPSYVELSACIQTVLDLGGGHVSPQTDPNIDIDDQ
jgi:hypothetical protein